jgi:energy-coupling factor transporter ATP-binding protein EcfA2
MDSSNWPFPGSRWWKFEFHAHTPKSVDGFLKTPCTMKDWLLAYMAAEVDCAAITDHNSGDAIPELKAALVELRDTNAAGYRPITLFPGVEISVNGGIHVLAIFDPAKGRDEIVGLLSAVSYSGTHGDSDGVTQKSLIEVLDIIREKGALPILAHVDEPKGLFVAIPNGQTLSDVLRNEAVAGIELRNTAYAKPGLYQKEKVRWPELLGSDTHNLASAGEPRFPGSHFTWIKMGTPALEALRLALVDGNGISVRRSDDAAAGFAPFQVADEIIEEIEIAEARFMGRGRVEKLTFNPWLNALVGGRGSGKSTVLQLARIALGRENELLQFPEEGDLRKSFERFRRLSRSRDDEGAVREPTRVTITFRHQGVRYQITWHAAQDGQLSVSEWDTTTNAWKLSASQAVKDRFPVRIFGQGQIAALASERSEALLNIIDQAVNHTEWRSRWSDAELAFFALRNRIRELEGKLLSKDRIVAALEDVRRKLARFEAQEHSGVLQAYQNRQRQAQEARKHYDHTVQVVQKIVVLAEETKAAELEAGVFDPANPVEQTVLAKLAVLSSAVGTAKTGIEGAANALRGVADAESLNLAATPWHADVKASRVAYEKLVADLETQGVKDPSEYGRLVVERDRLNGEVRALDQLTTELTTVKQQTDTKLQELTALRREITQKRQQFLAATLAGNPYVRIELVPYGKEALSAESSLRDALGISDETDKYRDDIYFKEEGTEAEKGVVAELLQNLQADAAARSTEVESRLTVLKIRLANECTGTGLTLGAWIRRRLQGDYAKRPEMLDRVFTWFPEDSLSVSYSARGDGQNFRPITQASSGQRAAAMLAFLLAYGDEPILIDQPEDDLDNHLIYGLVVQQMRTNKQRRQIITVTHNPNIVVNGDAEMVHVLDFITGQCGVSKKGSLQDAELREEICRVMEGGREAFEQRYRRIGKGSAIV